MASVPPRSRAAAHGDELADRSEQDGRVQWLGRLVGRAPALTQHRVRARARWRGSDRVMHVDGRALGQRHLRGEMRGRTEAVDAEPPAGGSSARRRAR